MEFKTSTAEEEYFAKENAEKKRLLAEAEQKRNSDDERARQKALHHMHCPKCGLTLQEIDYRAVKIDKCFGCGGIWLDDGEFEHVAEVAQSGFLTSFRGLFK